MWTDVNELSRVQKLIDDASAAAGSDYRLARALGTPRSVITEWRAGRRSVPAKLQALMADMIGLDGAQVALHAIIESEADPKRKEALLRVLGKVFRGAGALASLVAFVSGLWALSPEPVTAATLHDVYYVK